MSLLSSMSRVVSSATLRRCAAPIVLVLVSSACRESSKTSSTTASTASEAPTASAPATAEVSARASAAPTSAPATRSSATAAAKSEAPQTDLKKFLAWVMGLRMNMGAMGNDAGELKRANIAADGLDVKLKPFSGGGTSWASYLGQERDRVGPLLDRQHGPEVGALFRGATTSGVMVKLYEPSDPKRPFLKEFVEYMEASKIRRSLWSRLADMVKKGADRDAVVKEFIAMDTAIQNALKG